ncbi:hypothetical protein N332_01971, partial [Mesitornis unicolor]
GEIVHHCNHSLGSGGLESGGLDPDPNTVPWPDGLQSDFAILLMSLWRDQKDRKKTQTLQNDKNAPNYAVRGIKREYKIITGYVLILEK